MRIAQVAPLVERVPPEKYGGTERVIAALVAELVSLGHEVALYASGDSVTTAHLIPIVDRALWPTKGSANELTVHLTELARVLRESAEFDVVHSHLDCLAFPFARQSSTPWLHTLHGRLDFPELQGLFAEFPEAHLTLLRHFVIQSLPAGTNGGASMGSCTAVFARFVRAASQSHGVVLIAISDHQRAPLPHANWTGTIHNGVILDSLPQGSGSGSYLAFVGRISPEKGVADAIDVALGADMPLKIAARMPLEQVHSPWLQADREYYEQAIKPRLNHPLIEFVGEVDNEVKAELLGNAAALLFPINWPEPFGLVMIEALACGTPVIARALGSTPEIIRHGVTGLLCDSVREMVAACHNLESLDRAACRGDAERRFSSRAMADAYVRAYASVIGGGNL